MSLRPIEIETFTAISRQITAFFHCLDTGDIETAAEMFTLDSTLDMGVVDRPTVKGPDGLRHLFGARPENRAVRHHWSNLHVQSGSKEIAAVFQFATYTGAADSITPPTEITLGDVHILCRQSMPGDNWQFVKMQRTVVFAPTK